MVRSIFMPLNIQHKGGNGQTEAVAGISQAL
jgi:hypothetical protein